MFWSTAWSVWLSCLWRGLLIAIPITGLGMLLMIAITSADASNEPIGAVVIILGIVQFLASIFAGVWTLGAALKANELLPEQQKQK